MRELIDDVVPVRPLLENAPLKAVICQVQFPRQLNLGEDKVRPIQRVLSRRYPLLAEDQAVEVTVEGGPSPKAFLAPTDVRRRIFRFRDAEGAWTATIAPDAISLETTEYIGMKDLLTRWSELVIAAAEAFEITSQTRLGLRYINELDCPVHRREDLSSWVREELVTLLRAQPRAKHLSRFVSQAQFRQPDGSSCNMRHGLAPSEADDDRTVFLLDLDCFRGEAAEFDPVEQIRSLANLNQCAYGFFNWAFSSQTLESFGPERHAQSGIAWVRRSKDAPHVRNAYHDLVADSLRLDCTATTAADRGGPGRSFLLVKSREPVGPPESISGLLESMRESIDIPVADLARMIGLHRRQFYNLLSGGATSRKTEARVRRLAAAIERLLEATEGGPETVRAAVLTPVGPDAVSLFDVAVAGENERLTKTLEALLVQIETRGIHRVRRAIPRPASAEAAERRRRLMRESLADRPPRQPEREEGKG